jgi:acid phosphatase (class A)
MKRNRRRVCLLSVAALPLLISLEAAAADSSCADPAVPVAAILMPPPKQDSAHTKAELQELLRLQEARTRRQVEHVKGDDHRTVERFLGGMGIKVEQLSASANHFFECIGAAVEKSVRDAKTTFMRTRPYRLHESKLHTLKKLSDRDSTSYPSGHATYGAVVGMVLVEILPEKKEEIYKRIQDYGYSRLISGAHFRSDVYAGNIAGAAIAASLMNQDSFRDELKKVKVELRKAVGLESDRAAK